MIQRNDLIGFVRDCWVFVWICWCVPWVLLA